MVCHRIQHLIGAFCWAAVLCSVPTKAQILFYGIPANQEYLCPDNNFAFPDPLVTANSTLCTIKRKKVTTVTVTMNASVTPVDAAGSQMLKRQWFGVDACNNQAWSPIFTVTVKSAPPVPVSVPSNTFVDDPAKAPASQTLTLQGGCPAGQIVLGKRRRLDHLQDVIDDVDDRDDRELQTTTTYTTTWAKVWDPVPVVETTVPGPTSKDFLLVRTWTYKDNVNNPITYTQTVKVRDCFWGTLNPTTGNCDCTMTNYQGPGYCADADGRCTLYAKLDTVVNYYYCGDVPLSEQFCASPADCSYIPNGVCLNNKCRLYDACVFGTYDATSMSCTCRTGYWKDLEGMCTQFTDHPICTNTQSDNRIADTGCTADFPMCILDAQLNEPATNGGGYYCSAPKTGSTCINTRSDVSFVDYGCSTSAPMCALRSSDLAQPAVLGAGTVCAASTKAFACVNTQSDKTIADYGCTTSAPQCVVDTSGVEPALNGGGTKCFTTETYTIQLDLTNIPTNYRTPFENARQRWQSIIVRGIPDATGMPNSVLGCASPSTIDDVFICAKAENIDGAGANGVNIIGYGAPEFSTGTNALPSVGGMRFDLYDIPAKIQDGTFSSIIVHEMGHVLGIGTLWNDKGLVSQGGICYYKDKSAATREWQALTGCVDPIRLEQDFGDGSRCVHWDEFCFQDEVMSTNPAANTVMPISRMTVGTLDDLGYTVNYNAADSFNKLDKRCMCRGGGRRLRSVRPKVRRELSQIGEDMVQAYGRQLLTQAAEQGKVEGSYYQYKSVVILVEEQGELYSRRILQ